jgi:hypothetical protein
MFLRDFDPQEFLRSLAGTEPFAEYCRLRHVPLDLMHREPNAARWAKAVSVLPVEERARVERELATVNEMAGREGNAHLLDAAGESESPPADVPAGVPLALWFFLHHPDLFHEVFVHHEAREVRPWRVARTVAGAELRDLPKKALNLATELQKPFRLGANPSRDCIAESQCLPEGYRFTARLADRVRHGEWFTERGELTSGYVRPVILIHFVYIPRDGTVLLDSPWRPVEQIDALLDCFGRAVLGAPVERRAEVFDLDRLKFPFPLPRDAPDMETVRVTALYLRYPAGRGSRLVKLETLSGDTPSAIEEMLRHHLAGAVAEELRVTRAELQVRLHTEVGSRNYPIRLWRDRCDIGLTPLGSRLWRCLLRWGLCHAR